MGDSETPFATHAYGLDADDKEWKDDFPQTFREADQIDHDLERGRSTDIQAEEYLQRFKSQDGTPLGSLKARYCQFRKRKVYYLLWDDVEAAFPDVDHLIVRPSSCLFLVDKTCKLYVASFFHTFLLNDIMNRLLTHFSALCLYAQIHSTASYSDVK